MWFGVKSGCGSPSSAQSLRKDASRHAAVVDGPGELDAAGGDRAVVLRVLDHGEKALLDGRWRRLNRGGGVREPTTDGLGKVCEDEPARRHSLRCQDTGVAHDDLVDDYVDVAK